jgi:3-oxoacyl-[acyl-carrier protein] reductase
VGECVKTFGAIHILVNNAGKGTDPLPLESLPEAEWDRMLSLNLKGAYVCSRAVLPHLKRQEVGLS